MYDIITKTIETQKVEVLTILLAGFSSRAKGALTTEIPASSRDDTALGHLETYIYVYINLYLFIRVYTTTYTYTDSHKYIYVLHMYVYIYIYARLYLYVFV